jgi:hypothetical protein
MRKPDGTIDWDRTEQTAMRMDDAQIHYALVDIQASLPAADSMDRVDEGPRGGYYRDEASVLHRVREETTWDPQKKMRVKVASRRSRRS